MNAVYVLNDETSLPFPCWVRTEPVGKVAFWQKVHSKRLFDRKVFGGRPCRCTHWAPNSDNPPPEPADNSRADPEEWIPKNWTFDSEAVAKRFESHVREQLPWYDVLTASIVHVATHYIPENGIVYDVGASAGNLSRQLEPILRERKARMISVEKSQEMNRFAYRMGADIEQEWIPKDALEIDFEPYDFAAVTLVLMFMPVGKRGAFVERLVASLKPGGAVVIVDKVTAPEGYLGTVFRRMAIKWKLDAGAKAEEILAKELSLGGVQRPINPHIIPVNAKKFFQFGEFAGWVLEKPEEGRG